MRIRQVPRFRWVVVASAWTGEWRNGAFVPSSCAPPRGLDPVSAAPLTDAGLTPYHAVRRSRGKLAPGTTAVVIGVGGLGHLAVQIVKASTAARIVAVDTREEALALATDCGADVSIRSGSDTASEIRLLHLRPRC